MASTSPLDLEKIAYGQQGWNSIFNDNMQKINDLLTPVYAALNSTSHTDGQILTWNATSGIFEATTLSIPSLPDVVNMKVFPSQLAVDLTNATTKDVDSLGLPIVIFPSGGTDSRVNFIFSAPAEWTGSTFTARINYKLGSAPTAAEDVGFQVAANYFNEDETIALPTMPTDTPALIGDGPTDTTFQRTAIATVTPSGSGTKDSEALVVLSLSLDRTYTGTNAAVLDVDLHLYSLELQFTRNQNAGAWS